MKNRKWQSVSILSLLSFMLVILTITIGLTWKNTMDLTNILHDSVESNLLSISYAARSMLDIDKFDSYNRIEDVEEDAVAYEQTLSALRTLQKDMGATYIYALKQIGGSYYFVFDTDIEDQQIFAEYKLSAVHEQAFLGRDTAGILNVVDEWGSFNTAAIPIWKDGRVIGILCSDIQDTYIGKSALTSQGNMLYLVLAIVVTMGVLLCVLAILLRRVSKMQDELSRMATYDTLTGLPNRQCLMDYLRSSASGAMKKQECFALFFIDLDNFKRVNDQAGHDAGDEVLRHVGGYLNNIHETGVKSFRPTPGILNISARNGGAEFVQIVPGIQTETEAEIAAKRMMDHFSSPRLDPFIKKYELGLSVGIALFPLHTDDIHVLIKYADIAMYHAKNASKHTYRVFQFDMEPKAEK